ncbi:histidine phosphatase family protein, partial [Cutibacterium acnes]
MSGRTRLVLVRHGRTSYNVQGRLQGRLDIDLDEVGRRQVAATAPVIAAMEPAAVLSSPLQRARHTAEAIASAAG